MRLTTGKVYDFYLKPFGSWRMVARIISGNLIKEQEKGIIASKEVRGE